MFAEKTDDYSVFCSVVVVQILHVLMVPLSVFVALGVLLFSTVSALELTGAKWDAETLVRPCLWCCYFRCYKSVSGGLHQ